MIRRHFFLVAALVILALMVAVGGVKLLTRSDQAAAASGRGPGGGGGTVVSVTQVQPRTFADSIEVLGVAKGRQSVTLTAAATQLVERVRFKDGETVPRGAVLVELKDAEQDAGLAQAEARLVQAERAYERFQTLGGKGFASKADIDQYEAAWRSAQADVAAAKARRGDRLIRAPFAGVVGLSDIAPGALIDPGAPIVTLDDLLTIRVDFPVPERYMSVLREGQSITARADAYPGEAIAGRIAKLDTRVDENARALLVRAEFPNPGRRLKPGMMMRVSISRGRREALAAPESAVMVQSDSAFVFVLARRGEQTVAEQRPVVPGLRSQGFVELRDGASAGDRIVADGLNKLQHGQPVRLASAPAARPPAP